MIPKTKILFDGNCIVCDLEISHYKKVAPDEFELLDISDPQFQASHFNISKKDLETNLHVINSKGEVKIGVDAFAEIWSRIPKYSWGAKVICSPGILPLARIGYFAFTKIRPFLPKKNR